MKRLSIAFGILLYSSVAIAANQLIPNPSTGRLDLVTKNPVTTDSSATITVPITFTASTTFKDIFADSITARNTITTTNTVTVGSIRFPDGSTQITAPPAQAIASTAAAQVWSVGQGTGNPFALGIYVATAGANGIGLGVQSYASSVTITVVADAIINRQNSVASDTTTIYSLLIATSADVTKLWSSARSTWTALNNRDEQIALSTSANFNQISSTWTALQNQANQAAISSTTLAARIDAVAVATGTITGGSSGGGAFRYFKDGSDQSVNISTLNRLTTNGLSGEVSGTMLTLDISSTANMRVNTVTAGTFTGTNFILGGGGAMNVNAGTNCIVMYAGNATGISTFTVCGSSADIKFQNGTGQFFASVSSVSFSGGLYVGSNTVQVGPWWFDISSAPKSGGGPVYIQNNHMFIGSDNAGSGGGGSGTSLGVIGNNSAITANSTGSFNVPADAGEYTQTGTSFTVTIYGGKASFADVSASTLAILNAVKSSAAYVSDQFRAIATSTGDAFTAISSSAAYASNQFRAIANSTATFSTNTILNIPIMGYSGVGASTMALVNSTYSTINGKVLFDHLSSTAGLNYMEYVFMYPARIDTTKEIILRRFTVKSSSGNQGENLNPHAQSYVISVATTDIGGNLANVPLKNQTTFSVAGSSATGANMGTSNVTLNGWASYLGSNSGEAVIRILRDAVTDASDIQTVFLNALTEIRMLP